MTCRRLPSSPDRLESPLPVRVFHSCPVRSGHLLAGELRPWPGALPLVLGRGFVFVILRWEHGCGFWWQVAASSICRDGDQLLITQHLLSASSAPSNVSLSPQIAL